MKTVAIIQARMGSSRLPKKVLANILGKTMIERIIERVLTAKKVDHLVVATTLEKEDDALADYVQNKLNRPIFRGSTNDVLARFFQCAKLYNADIIVRITADDPLKDPQLIDKALDLLHENPELDYCSNTIEPTYPEGLDIEVFRFQALERAHSQAQLASDREHVTPYIWRHPELFHVLNFTSDRNLSHWRWTVDKPIDLEFIEKIYTQFSHVPLIRYQDVVTWLDSHPAIQTMNSATPRNEGYLKSLNMEKKQ